MSYKLTFLVLREKNGYATYLAKTVGGSSPPYQKLCSNDMCEQFYYFKDISVVNKFLMRAYKELSDASFTLISLEYVKFQNE